MSAEGSGPPDADRTDGMAGSLAIPRGYPPEATNGDTATLGRCPLDGPAAGVAEPVDAPGLGPGPFGGGGSNPLVRTLRRPPPGHPDGAAARWRSGGGAVVAAGRAMLVRCHVSSRRPTSSVA